MASEFGREMVFFTRLIQVIARAADRIWPTASGAPYRPEKHYMRGSGPKSQHSEAAGGGTPRTT